MAGREEGEMSMDDEIVKKDMLFVVPSQYLEQRSYLIRTILWAVDSPKTFDTISGDAFAAQYSDMAIKDVVEHMKARYEQVGHNGDLSKREQKAYDRIMSGCVEHMQKDKEPTL